MATVHLVRHGKAAAGFGSHADPGLDDLGRRQAEAAADVLEPLGPLEVISSPLARARETAVPLAGRWGADILIEPRVAEIPSPTDDLEERAAWLRQAMAGNWSDLGDELVQWRSDLVICLLGYTEDVVIFSHFIAINGAVGAANGDDRLVIFSPDNGSITRLSNDNGRLTVIEMGRTAATRVN